MYKSRNQNMKLMAAAAIAATTPTSLFAASATWLASPTSSVWNYTSGTVSNWTPANAIPGVTTLDGTNVEVATFNASSQLTVLPDSNRTIGSLLFGGSAGSYTIGAVGGYALDLAGNGAGSATVNTTGNNVTVTLAGPIVMLRDYQFISGGTGTNDAVVISGSVTNQGAAAYQMQLKGTNTSTANIASGTISDGTYALKLTKLNAGTWTVAGDNTFTGATAIGQGNLIVSTINHVASGTIGGVTTAAPAASSNLGAPTTAANGTISIGSTTTTGQLTYVGTGETTDRVIALAGTTGGAILDQSGTGLLKFTGANVTATGVGVKTLTLQGSTAGTGEIAGVIRNNGGTSLTKIGTGSWTLSGANTTANAGFTGATTVSGGTLLLANANAVATTASVTVAGGTLSSNVASTNIGGNLLLSGGSITPGDVSTGTFALASTKTFTMSDGTWGESIASTSLFDAITGSGGATFSITGGALDLTGSTINYASSYAILSGFTSGSVAGLTITGYDTADYTAALSNTGVLSFTTVPEPASLALLVLGSVGLLRRRK